MSGPTRLYRVVGDRVHLAFHPGQAAAWRSTRRFVLMLAGSQGGKTSFGPWWLYKQIYTTSTPTLPSPVYGGGERGGGGGDYLAVTATYDLFKLKMLPEIRTVFEELLGLGRFWAGDGIMELRPSREVPFWAERASDIMWGRIILRSASSEGGLESVTARAAWLDEAGQAAFTLEAWEAVLRRLSLAQGRCLITTTPYNLGWLKNEVYDRWAAGDPDYEVVQFESVLNPAFPREEYERARRTLPSWKFAMFYRGQFTRPAGLIYADFDPAVHLCEPFPIPSEWPRYVGIDFGAVHTATVWLAVDVEREVVYVYRESLQGGLTTAEHCRRCLELARADGAARVHWFGGAPSEVQERRDWTAAGVPVRQPPVGDVEAGIDRVVALLRERRLFFFRTLAGLRDELGSYSREVDARGEPTEGIRDKEQYHRLDALRYAVAGLSAPKRVARSFRGFGGAP